MFTCNNFCIVVPLVDEFFCGFVRLEEYELRIIFGRDVFRNRKRKDNNYMIPFVDPASSVPQALENIS